MIRVIQVISDTNIGGGGRSLLNYLACWIAPAFLPVSSSPGAVP